MQKKIKTEFHVHTKASKDSILNKVFILVMCKIHKINCIAITDHNEIWYAKKNKNFFEKRGIKVIVGEEIFSADGEIIGLFLNEGIPKGLSAEETIKEIKKQNGLVYIPHPYDEKREKTVLKKEALEKNIEDIDFIECYNGRNIKKEFSDIQEMLVKKYNKTGIVGSDAHTFFELGRNYIELENVEKEKIIESVKNGNFKKQKCIKFAHEWTKIVKSLKLLKKGEFNEIRRIINGKCRGRNKKISTNNSER